MADLKIPVALVFAIVVVVFPFVADVVSDLAAETQQRDNRACFTNDSIE